MLGEMSEGVRRNLIFWPFKLVLKMVFWVFILLEFVAGD